MEIARSGTKTMRAGNSTYTNKSDLPQIIPVFPLSGALLLPNGQMPLNIFEPRYLAMIDDAMAGDRIIGMIQPALNEENKERSELCEIGCLGRITGLQESNDGRYLINLAGICRFKVISEIEELNGYRRCEISPVESDLENQDTGEAVDRDLLLKTFRNYLEANNMEADWESIDSADNETLVTALCMMSPYGPAEKQALLEADSLKDRADTLVALTEIALGATTDVSSSTLQ